MSFLILYCIGYVLGLFFVVLYVLQGINDGIIIREQITFKAVCLYTVILLFLWPVVLFAVALDVIKSVFLVFLLFISVVLSLIKLTIKRLEE